MRIRGHVRHGGRGLLLPLAGLLGAALVVLPAVAGSETAPSIQAYGAGPYFSWSPPTATINAGGAVTFANPSSEVSHGVEWRPGNPATPSCSAGVPVGTTGASSGTKWSGTCTFTAPGVYEFWCTVHRSEMKGTVTVNATGTTTTTTTTTPSTTTASGGQTPGPTSGPQGSSPSYGALASPLAGSAANAVKLPASQRGRSVRGSVEISQAGQGGRLEVDLLAKSASLASAGHAAKVRVGTLVLSQLKAGSVPFSVPLNSRARGALRRHRRLALSARIGIRAAGASVLTITRSVVVHP
jgi:plastocyanin